MGIQASLVFNPASGRRTPKQYLLPHLLEELRGVGIDAEPAACLFPGHATDLVREALGRRVDLVIVWGGDGTLNEAVGGMLGSATPLGLIPGGSVNVFARTTGVPLGRTEACRMLVKGEPRSVPVGVAGGRAFLLMTGIGLDAEVIHRLSPGVKRRLGKLAFWVIGFGLLPRYPFPPFTVRVEGKEHRATGLVAGKTQLYGGRYVVTPDARLDEPFLDVIAFQGGRGADYLRYLIGVLLGIHVRFEDVFHIKTTEFEVDSPRPVLYQVDGELAGATPVAVGIHRQALRVILPSSRGARSSGKAPRDDRKEST